MDEFYTALLALCEKYGISLEELLAILAKLLA